MQPPAPQSSPDVRLAVHRATGVVRRLIRFPKPGSVEQQHRLRCVARRLGGVRSEGVAQVVDVFEDARSLSLLAEHCNGGVVHDRILQRQYFAEQESAMLVRHMLQSLAALHDAGLSHGFLTPISFRFYSDEPHASLKLVDYGMELQAGLLDACSGASLVARRRTACPQLWETCRLVFCAPEVVRRSGEVWEAPGAPGATRKPVNDKLLGEAIEALVEQGVEATIALQAADSWAVGAIAFLLLCGYPPFFAPCRRAILSRIERTDFAFDPPFWSKVSEEAKDFVQLCLRASPARRPTVLEALEHPWIRSLADSSAGGSMLSSFALNLRRFCKTSIIEACTASVIAASLSAKDAQDIFARCREADRSKNGFLTATELREIFIVAGCSEIAEATASCFGKVRHPGESYIDYEALMESAQLRAERLVEEELWHCFAAFEAPCAGLSVSDVLQSSEVQRLLARTGVEVADLCGALRPEVIGAEAVETEFIDISVELTRRLPSMAQARGSPREVPPKPAQPLHHPQPGHLV